MKETFIYRNALPVAESERWQPLRSGLINLFYYDNEVFYFADGHLLLRGNNGTGKSRVMALQLPFLLDGEVSASRMEPDGDRAKRVEWHLLMGGKYKDRLGYTWVEFGRKDEEGVQHYLTLGCGLFAAQGRGLADKWFFVTSQRVGEDLALVSKGNVPLGKNKLKEILSQNNSGELFPTAKAYRKEVDHKLFGLGGRYKALVDLLIQLRQPQLSRDFNEKVLSDALNEALPPLPADVIGNVADSFRSLEEDREQLEGAVKTLKAVASFNQYYQRYARIALRRRTEKFLETHREHDRNRRKLNADRLQHTELVHEQEQISEELQRLEETVTILGSRIATLEKSDAMRGAQALANAQDQLILLSESKNNLETDFKEVQKSLEEAEQKVSETEERTLVYETNCSAAFETLVLDLPKAGMEQTYSSFSADLNFPEISTEEAIQQFDRHAKTMLGKRHEDYRHLLQETKEVDQAEQQLTQEKKFLTESQSELTSREEEYSEAVHSFEKALTDYVERFRAWCEGTEQLSAEFPESMSEEIADWGQSCEGDNPIKQRVDEALATFQKQVEELRYEERQNLESCREELGQKEAEAEQLRIGTHLPPVPPFYRDEAARQEREGAPLWLLCEFNEDVPHKTQVAVEAALEASGILDAWVTPAGELIREDEHDVFLQVIPEEGVTPQDNLNSLLRPVSEASELEQCGVQENVIQQILSRIGLGKSTHHTWITQEGQWKIGPLQGRWQKSEVQHIGLHAREEARRKKLAETELHIEQLREQLQLIERALADLEARRLQGEAEAGQAPDDRTCQRHFLQKSIHLGNLENQRKKVMQYEEKVLGCQQKLETLVQRRDEEARILKLEGWIDNLEGFQGLLHQLENRFTHLSGQLQQFWLQKQSLLGAERWMESQKLNNHEIENRLQEAKERWLVAQSQVDTLRESVGESAEKVIAQRDECQFQLQETRKEAATYRDKERAKLVAVTKLNDSIENQELELEQILTQRENAMAWMKELFESGLGVIAHEDFEKIESCDWTIARTFEIAKNVEKQTGEFDFGNKAWENIRNNLMPRHQEFGSLLSTYNYHVTLTRKYDLDLVSVQINWQEMNLHDLTQSLKTEIDQRREMLSAQEREVLENHLMGEVSQFLHERLHDASDWVNQMNAELQERPMSTGMELRFKWDALKDGPDGLKKTRSLLLRNMATWSPEEREIIKKFLQNQIDEARNEDEGATWQDHLARAFDYRYWHSFYVEKKQDGEWEKLDKKKYGTGSGGEKAIAITIPRFAAAAAHYRSANGHAPRLILLDEAFVGIDSDMRSKCMELIKVFDLDFMMTSEREWGCYSTLPAVSIYQLSRRKGIDAIGVTPWLWNGKQRSPMPEFSLDSQKVS